MWETFMEMSLDLPSGLMDLSVFVARHGDIKNVVIFKVIDLKLIIEGTNAIVTELEQKPVDNVYEKQAQFEQLKGDIVR